MPTPVRLAPNVNPGFSPCIINGILKESQIMYVDDHNANSVALTGLSHLKKSCLISNFIILGFGLTDMTSKP